MAKKYTRTELLAYLREIRAKGAPIVVAGAGSGLTGKAIEAGGADMLMVFNSGKYRMRISTDFPQPGRPNTTLKSLSSTVRFRF